MSINFTDKVNERSIPQAITNEQHLVGILATITYSPGNIRLIEVPESPNPFSTVDIWSGSGHTGTHYNEITSGTPTGTQYLVDYTTGVISFATAQDGNTVYVDYNGLGSEWAAEDVNEIQNPLSAVSTQVVTYNWPSAPTVSWKLADTIVKPASISTTPTDDFTFPRDLTVSGLSVSLPVQTNGSKKLISAAIDLSGSQVTGNLGTTHLNSGTGASGTTFWRGDGTWGIPAGTTTPASTDGAVQFNDSNIFGGNASKLFWDKINFRLGIGTNSPSVSLDVSGSVNLSTNLTVPTGSITQAETYSGSGSEQGIASDETLSASAGSNTPTNPKYLASIMGNVHGASLTRISNYIAGVIGADSVTGTQATTYPKGAVLAQITDGVTEANGAVVAYIDGDSSVTTANAAFKAMSNNSNPGSGFTYGLDLFGAAHDGYNELAIFNADVRLSHEVCILNGSATPTNGVTGAGFAQIGSLYIKNSTGELYSNTGTKAVPVWTIFDTGTTGANVNLSNLSTVAVNTSILPGTDNSIDLGSALKEWKNLFISTNIFTPLISPVTGNNTIDMNNGVLRNVSGSSVNWDLKVLADGGLDVVRWGTKQLLDTPGNIVLEWGTAHIVKLTSAVLDMNTHQIHNVVDPSSAQDAATKNYVDGGAHTVAGTTGAVQFNSSGAFNGNASKLFWDNTNFRLGIGTNTPSWDLTVSGATAAFTGQIIVDNVNSFSGGGSSIDVKNRRLFDSGNNPIFYWNTAGAIGINNATPDASAVLDVASTTQGFLPPRMTTTQRNAISSPATGLMIYNTTDNQWEGWNGTSWAILG